MKSSFQGYKKNKGVTLVELIASIAILIVVMATIGAVTQSIFQDFTRFMTTSDRNEHESNIRMALLAIVRDARASDSIYTVSKAGSIVEFGGFNATSPGGNDVRIAYELQDGDIQMLHRIITDVNTNAVYTGSWFSHLGFIPVPLADIRFEFDDSADLTQNRVRIVLESDIDFGYAQPGTGVITDNIVQTTVTVGGSRMPNLNPQ